VRSVRALHSGWSVRSGGAASGADAESDAAGSGSAKSVGPVAATVPGCVHTDLMAAGVIPDPFIDDNETRLGWIGRIDWVYETSFTVDDLTAERHDLVCAGLDTVATVTLNGVEVGHTQNMHRGYRFDVRDTLRPGANDLRVEFASAYAYAEHLREVLGDRPSSYDEPYRFIRKMACNFGWDWGPTVVTAGIWQPIALESWSRGRLAQVVPQVSLAEPSHDALNRGSQAHSPIGARAGLVQVHLEVERTGNEPLTVTATICGVQATASVDESATLELAVDDPELWWPRGYGSQHLHSLRVELTDADGAVLDSWERRIGFRSVRVSTTPDEHGTPFTLIVNDTPVFARGFNWIPDDAFVTRVTRKRYARRLSDACEANANYLRVWGGGRYESDDFYDVADELGLMVGQDFLFACSAYPEEEPFASEVAAEAHEQVVRLASHPSLVLWTGNNENVWGWHDWGWQQPLAGRTWGAGFYFDLLPSTLAALDPTRPYWPSSPWSGSSQIHPNDPAYGTSHEWEVWNRVDYAHYRDAVPRFMAEFGFQAPPAYATLRRWLSDEPLARDSPGMTHHQKAQDGDGKLQRGLDAHLPAPGDFDDWHYLTQLNQARAVSLGVQHYRSHRPVCMGALVWQLNDNWPVTSWAAVDGDGRRKPLWHELRRVFADRLLTIQPRDGRLALIAVNETDAEWSGTAEVTRYTLDGARRAKHPVELRVAPRSSSVVALPSELMGVTTPDEVLRAEFDDRRAWWFFAEDRAIAYPPARFTATVAPAPSGFQVSVTAGTILRDLTLFPDRLDESSTVDTALVTLLPGETHTFMVYSRQALDPVALTSRPVLRCVNDIVPNGGAVGGGAVLGDGAS
jgi:beta-mannosidase